MFDDRGVTAALAFPARPVSAHRERSVLDSGNVEVGALVGNIDRLARRVAPPLPVADALRAVLPEGLPRGSTIAVHGSVSLLLALLGTASQEGAWSALVAMPRVSVEAAVEYGVDPARLVVVPDPGTEWSAAVSVLVDALDLVVVRPPATLPSALGRRLSARARSKDAVLLTYLGGAGLTHWPGADVVLTAATIEWTGLGDLAGHGRLRGRQVELSASGRGRHAPSRTTRCWLPAPLGRGIDSVSLPGPEVARLDDRRAG
jgi:hypothetical protein